MSKTDPFATFVSEATLSAIVKNLEKRWGLTLVSFLPAEAQERVVQLQNQISKRLTENGNVRKGRLYVEFYQPQQFHCTHLTLTRSDPGGPTRAKEFVKQDHQIFELFEAVQSVSSQIQPIKVRLGRLRIARDRFGIVLVGKCVDEGSAEYRQTLLTNLNQSLPQSFNLSRRRWDTDASKFHKLHCSLGYLKRSPPHGYGSFAENLEQIDFEPIVFTLADIALVHHRHRTLAFPQEGMVTFQLGKEKVLAKEEFVQEINLSG